MHHNYVNSCYILLIISRYFWLLLLLMELLYTAVYFLWVKYFLHHCRQRRYAPAFSGCILLLGCQQQLVIIQSQLIVFFCLCYRGCETGLQPDHHSSAYPLQLGLRVHKAALWHTEGQAAQLWGVHPVSPGRFHADSLLSLFFLYSSVFGPLCESVVLHLISSHHDWFICLYTQFYPHMLFTGCFCNPVM